YSLPDHLCRFRVRAARNSLEAFLGSMGSPTSPKPAPLHVSALMRGGFTYHTAYTLAPGQPPPGISYPPASPHRLPTTTQVPSIHPSARKLQSLNQLAQMGPAWTLLRGYGNINPFSIDYASR